LRSHYASFTTSVPFPAADMMDTSSASMLGTSAEACRHKDALGNVVDTLGISVMDPRSKCFKAHALLGSGI
jgi:hypothetical protein